MVEKWEWVGKVDTFTGKEIELINFRSEDVDIRDIVQSLCNICRFNGHVPSFYSVAEHSVRAADFAIQEGMSTEMALTALLHDAAEAYVGDMVRPLKRHPEYGAAHQKLENKILEVIHWTLGGIYPHPPEIEKIDKQMYLWECDHIRSGKILGWMPIHAKIRWIETYKLLTRAHKKD